MEKRGSSRRQEDMDMMAQASEAHELATTALQQIASHEKLCGERFLSISATLNDFKETLRWAAKGLIVGMLALLVMMIFSNINIHFN